jgi:lipid-A-disaccharide synthase
MHAGLVLDAAARILEARPDALFIVPLVSRTTRDAFLEARHRGGHDALPVTVLYGHAGDALRAADVALVASGTATLEAALARCPHVIFYRVSALTARIVRRKLLVPWVGLPNVLAGRFVVPELLQEDATPGNLAQAALNLFDDTVTRRRIETLFGRMGDALALDTGELAADALLAELDRVPAGPGAHARLR